MANVVDEINTVVGQLSPDHQKRVLEYAQSLAQPDQLQIPGLQLPMTPPPGVPGSALLRFTLPTEDVAAMEKAIEECERIESDEY